MSLKMSNGATEIRIRELDLDIIPPCTSRMNERDYGGSKIVVIGKPGTGKTELIKSLLYAKKHIIPVGMAMSGSEDTTGDFSRIFPNIFVYNEYKPDKVEGLIQRQKFAKEHLANPWAVLILDDCTDEPKIFNTGLQRGLYKRGRHFKLWYILSLQYALDIRPAIRTNVDGVFIMKEANIRNRKSLWENYAGIIPDFSLFCDILDQLCENYTSIYIDNQNQSNNWQDKVFYYKANRVPDSFKFGCKEFWKFSRDREDPTYKAPLM